MSSSQHSSQELLHELEVHRVELRSQNEQLRLREQELSETRDRYFDLFDRAPVAYVTVDRDGRIEEANFAAADLLSTTRSSIIGRKISSFVRSSDADALHLFRRGLYKTDSSDTSHLACTLDTVPPTPVRLQGLAYRSQGREESYAHIAIVDLSAITRAQSDLARQQRELRRTEDRLADFMRATSDSVIVLSAAGIIKAVNPAVLRLLGGPAEKMIGSHISRLTGSAFPSLAAEMVSTELTWTDAKGSPHTVLVTSAPIREPAAKEVTEYLCVAQDITERKQAEERLRLSESMLRQMAETIEDGFYIREYPSGELSYVSPAYEELFGVSQEELNSHPGPPLSMVHAEDVEQLTQAYESFVKGDPCDEQFRIIRPDGEVRWIRERAFLVEEKGGNVERIVGIAQDTTDQRQLELELRQGQKMEAVGQLASGVAHDFNNILMGIHGCASIALSKMADTSEVRPFLDAIRQSSESGTAIIKQLLAFSSKRELEVRSFDLNELILSDETMLARLLGDDVILSIRVADEPCYVRMDVGQMEQILMNLAINARDAMPGGGELFIVTSLLRNFLPSRSEVSRKEYVELRVQDTGVGMSEAVRERIFEPFFTTKDIGEGTGLGLSTVYGLVQEADGLIHCQSEPGSGAAFIVRLPRAESESEPDKDLEAEMDTWQCTEKARNILLVEDEETVRFATRLYLESAGYNVIEAPNSKLAFEIFSRGTVPIDMLLTDVGLPGGNGATLAAKCRELEPELRILFMSAHPSDWLAKNRRLGAEEVTLQKPFSQTELIEKVMALLSPAR